ncbi:Tat binding protein 1-interacting protein-domain-containing protein [Gongronella butleri]|nr:Tat binding protein 1-interacting protein-domain-containing protein [Gongronella butleri]
MSKRKAPSAPLEDEVVVHFMRFANRPHNAQIVTNMLPGKHTKTKVAAALNRLVKEDKLVSKTYNKNTLYWHPINAPEVKIDEEQSDKAKKMLELREQWHDLKKQIIVSEKELQELKSTPPTAEAFDAVESLRHENTRLRGEVTAKRLAPIEKPYTPEQLTRISNELALLHKATMNRRKTFYEILKTVSDNMNITTSRLLDSMGIDAGSLPTPRPL